MNREEALLSKVYWEGFRDACRMIAYQDEDPRSLYYRAIERINEGSRLLEKYFAEEESP